MLSLPPQRTAQVPLSVGSEVVFGDQYLAAFKLEEVAAPKGPAQSSVDDPMEEARRGGAALAWIECLDSSVSTHCTASHTCA